MQLGLNLINDERILDLVRDFEEDRSTPQPELLEDDNEEMNKKPAEFSSELDIGVLEILIANLMEKKEKRSKSSSESPEEEDNDDKIKTAKDSTLKGIVKEIDMRFGAKQKKSQRKKTGAEYLDPELMKASYGLNLADLFSYLKSTSATDVYKDFYSNGSKDAIYNFVDEPLSYAKLQKIQTMTKIARYSGYMGETEYCGHELLDADTKEKWHLIRNMAHVLIMTMIRYDVALQ